MLAVLLLAAVALPQGATPPAARGWDGFPVFVWREEHAGKPLPPELVEPFGGVILMRDEDSAWARERGLEYLVWNVAGRAPFHLDADEAWRARVERWIETRDEKLLVREPCLGDPATLARAFATLDATLAKHGEHPGLAFVLGDEVSLTPNGSPLDLCRCGHCASLWADHARNRELPERMPLTDDVLAALRSGRFDGLGAWLELRRFQHARLFEQLEAVAHRIESRSTAPVALLGLAGQTPFGGLAVERVPFPIVEAYPLPGLRELLAQPWRHEQENPSWRRSLATLFLENESPAGASWLAFEHWLNGADGLVLWSDRGLARAPEARARLAQSVRTIRALQPSLSPSRWSPRSRYGDHGQRGSVALLVDADSNALAFLHDALEDGKTWPRRFASYQQEHGSNERRLQAWLRALERLQIVPTVTTLDLWRDELAAGADLKCAVLLGRRVLDPADLELLERATGHGLLVVDGPIAEVDRQGRPLPADTLPKLRERLGPRLIECDTHEDEADLTQLATWVAQAGLEAPPVARFTGAAARLEWLTFHAAPARGRRWLVAALPAAPTGANRSALADLALAAEAPEGWELRWIHPTASPRVLRAGDAALYELVDPAEEAARKRRKEARPR